MHSSEFYRKLYTFAGLNPQPPQVAESSAVGDDDQDSVMSVESYGNTSLADGSIAGAIADVSSVFFWSQCVAKSCILFTHEMLQLLVVCENLL